MPCLQSRVAIIISKVNKRQLHHMWTKFRTVKPWYFLAATIIFGTVAIASLRSNNQHMVNLRSAVYAADKSGGDIKAALNSLRSYVNGHMNTSLATPDGVYPPIQLKYTYDRLVTAESSRVNAINTQVYTQAQHYCEQQDSVDFSGHNRVPCITQYVSSHGAKSTPIPDSLYKFSFASPQWSPDLAGWTLVFAVLSLVLFVISWLTDRWFQRHVA